MKYSESFASREDNLAVGEKTTTQERGGLVVVHEKSTFKNDEYNLEMAGHHPGGGGGGGGAGVGSSIELFLFCFESIYRTLQLLILLLQDPWRKDPS